ncbi:MAG: GntR family transcriptional regulator, partial [Marivirga sp.]|nr:GntR family transcriptional regulator [Marivirga sp.]
PPLLTPGKLKDVASPFKLPDRPIFKYDEKKVLPFFSDEFPASGKLVLNDGSPDSRLAPIEDLVKSIRSLARISSNKKYLMYGGAQGTFFLRETLATFLNDTRGLSIRPDNILITKGAQMGIYISSSILLKPKAEIIVGCPGYRGAHRTFEQLGAKIHFVPVDQYGLDIDAVEKICRKRKIVMVYVIPHHHYPTTTTLIPERRIRLLDLASTHRFAIIEDDYDYDFHYDSKPMMPMASLDRSGSVVYVGTLTKSLAPAIRFGFIVAPAEFIRIATNLRKSIDAQGDSLIENAIADLYKSGVISRHIKKSLKLYKDRRDHFCDLLQHEIGNHISFKIPEGGMSVWTKFVTNDLSDVAARAFKKGLVMRNGSEYDTEKMKYNSVGLGFASLNFKEQEKAIGILKGVLMG